MEILRSMLGQLGINKSFFVMFGIFVVTYFLVSQIALKKLSRTLIEREERTEGREHEAAHLNKDLDGLREKLRISVQEARAKANTEFLKIRTKAMEDQRNIITAARDSAGAELKKTRASVGAQFATEMQKLEADVPKISQAILAKLLNTAKNADSSLSSELE